MSLKEKAVSGLIWTFAEQFAGKGIGFIVHIILARILLPEEFGLIAMIMVFIGIGHSLVDSGMTQSLIRTLKPDQRDYSTVFFINTMVSLVVYGLIYAGAPAIAQFYEKPILVGIIRLYSLVIIIQSFVAVQITRMTKAMNFRIQMIIEVPSIVIGGITGIVLALYGWGVWSLVYMAIVRSIVSTTQYWIYTGWRPDFIIDRSRLWNHFNFGYKLTLSGLLNTIFVNAYNIIIGKYFSATQVGFYSKADQMQRFPVQTLSNALNRVTYPMFSEIQNEDEKLRQVYQKVMKQVVFWITPTLTIGFILAEPLFRLVLTEKWLPAVPYFRILCFVGLLYPIQAYNLNILKVKGRSDLILKLSVVKRVIIVIGILIALPYGIYGLLYFQVIHSFIAFVINSYYSGKFINYSIYHQMRDLVPLIFQGIIPGVLCYLTWQVWGANMEIKDFWIIVFEVLNFLFYAAVIIYVFRPSPYFEIKDVIRTQLKKN